MGNEKVSDVKYITSNKYILREIAGESVLVSVGDGVADFCGIVKLNPSAAFIWKTLQGGATEQELVRAVTECFEVSGDKAAEDVDKCLDFLKGRGMIVCE